MRHDPEHEALETARYVGMDLVVDGFAGVLVEIRRRGASGAGQEEYVLLETAAGSGNRLLSFASRSRERVYELFGREVGETFGEEDGGWSEDARQDERGSCRRADAVVALACRLPMPGQGGRKQGSQKLWKRVQKCRTVLWSRGRR